MENEVIEEKLDAADAATGLVVSAAADCEEWEEPYQARFAIAACEVAIDLLCDARAAMVAARHEIMARDKSASARTENPDS